MINIFVLVTILGHLPVILSAKSKGSENMEQILIVEDDSFLNKMLFLHAGKSPWKPEVKTHGRLTQQIS